MSFTLIPNNFFYTLDENKSIFKETKDFRTLLVLDYLYINTNRNNISMFSLEDIIETYGYKVDKHKGKNVDKFKAILKKLKELEIIKFLDDDINLDKLKVNKLTKCYLNSLEKDKDNNYIKFVTLKTEEKEIIFNTKENIDNVKLLTYYLYIKCRIYKRNNGDLIQANGGRAEVCWVSYKTINKDLGLSDEVINKYNNILENINLLRLDNPGLYFNKDDKYKNVRESPNVYTLYTEDEEIYKNNLKEGIKYYQKIAEEKVFINSREYKHNNRKNNGYIARIEYLEKEGKATKEQIQKKNDVKEDINKLSENKLEVKKLFEKFNAPLSQIKEYKLSQKYYYLEKDLGLLDEFNSLTVDFSYYKWIMINYTKDKHDFYFNCIKKHKKEQNKVSLNDEVWGNTNPLLDEFDDEFDYNKFDKIDNMLDYLNESKNNII